MTTTQQPTTVQLKPGESVSVVQGDKIVTYSRPSIDKDLEAQIEALKARYGVE